MRLQTAIIVPVLISPNQFERTQTTWSIFMNPADISSTICTTTIIIIIIIIITINILSVLLLVFFLFFTETLNDQEYLKHHQS